MGLTTHSSHMGNLTFPVKIRGSKMFRELPVATQQGAVTVIRVTG